MKKNPQKKFITPGLILPIMGEVSIIQRNIFIILMELGSNTLISRSLIILLVVVGVQLL
jgi:hypothetical protein